MNLGIRRCHTTAALFVCVVFVISTPEARALPPTDWAVQFGSGGGDFALAAALDRWGNALVSGQTEGDPKSPTFGNLDAYLRKLDPAGVNSWSQQIGTQAEFEASGGVAADFKGNIYLSGNIGAADNATETDAFLDMRTADGALLWRQYLGSSGSESSVSMALAGPELSHLYISGATDGTLVTPTRGGQDLFLARYDILGNQTWVRQFGSSMLDFAGSMAADHAGNAIVAGSTDGSFIGSNRGRRDLFVQKYDSHGALQWTHQDGTTMDDVAVDVAVDRQDNIYIAGYTQNGSLIGGTPRSYDAFLRKISPEGAVLWTRQLVSNQLDYGIAVAVAADGLVYMGGQTTGSLEGTNAGGFDAYYAVFGQDGVMHALEQFGSSRHDDIQDIAANRRGDIVFVGGTLGSLFQINAGFLDGFAFKISVVPEPRSASVLAVTAIVACSCRTAARRTLPRPPRAASC
jgi:hypothetical protein